MKNINKIKELKREWYIKNKDKIYKLKQNETNEQSV